YRRPGSGFVRGTGSGSTAFVVAAACVNRGFSVPADRPAGWASPVQGIERLPTHGASQELAPGVTSTATPDHAPLSARAQLRRALRAPPPVAPTPPKRCSTGLRHSAAAQIVNALPTSGTSIDPYARCNLRTVP